MATKKTKTVKAIASKDELQKLQQLFRQVTINGSLMAVTMQKLSAVVELKEPFCSQYFYDLVGDANFHAFAQSAASKALTKLARTLKARAVRR